MGVISSVISNKELTIEFNSAKIIASPYDYKLTDRILLYPKDTCYEYYNIFTKTWNTEGYLCEVLGLNVSLNYIAPRTEILKVASASPACCDCYESLRGFEYLLGNTGTFIRYNNLVINEDALANDLTKHLIPALHLKTFKYLKALEVWFLKSTDKSSLIPNLMYLTSTFKDRSLEDMENIVFAEEAIANKIAPVLTTCRGFFKDPIRVEAFFDGNLVPMAYTPEDIKKYACIASDVNDNFFNLGRVYSIVYGIELLYWLDNIPNDLQNALKDLLCLGYKDNSFCAKYLYTRDVTGEIEINPKVKACFSTDNNCRFDSIRMYLDSVITDSDFCKDVQSDFEYFGLPTFFARAVMNMHAYAYQVARVKHATLLYKKAKDAGLIDKNTFKSTIEGSSSLFSSDVEEDSAVSNELIDLSSFSCTDESASPEDLIEKEKEVSKKQKEGAPSLAAADMLKKDLEDSRYTYDITYVKNDVSNKDAYNLIASHIKMITHELSRQIKEIKTYNTGGKQNGLLVGKLDKKNLWKYKTDPHIFYNNNYKLKEMDLAFGCILDESGSMYGEKIKNGRIVMIMLHEVLNSLGINHSIIGHTSNNNYQTKIYKYFQFKEENHYTLDKPYGLVKADNRNGNCDSGALYYMESVMKQVRNKDKIVIIFSDGQPTECTDLDLTEQVRHMEKNGIHVIGVGINFSSIKEYYPDNANGKNLKEMVDIVVSILKRYVLEKKE